MVETATRVGLDNTDRTRGRLVGWVKQVGRAGRQAGGDATAAERGGGTEPWGSRTRG